MRAAPPTTQVSLAPAPATPAWLVLELHEWMWRPDALGLRGCELLAFSAIYAACAGGTEVFCVTCDALGSLTGYPRETISRTLTRLTERGLIYHAGTVRDEHTKRPIRALAVSYERIASRISSLSPTGCDLLPAPRLTQGAGACPPTHTGMPAVTEVGTASILTPEAVYCEATSPADASQRGASSHPTSVACEASSRALCDASSPVSSAHMAELGHVAGKTYAAGDVPIRISSSLSKDQDEDGTYGIQVPCAREDAAGARPRTLTTAELTCFRSLVATSILPVDDAYLAANLRAYSELVSEDVPAQVILAAWSDYVAHKRQQLRTDPNTHVMHLLTWLRLKPNRNIGYLLRKEGRDRAPSTPTQTMPQAEPAPRPLKLSRCHDRRSCVWFVHEGSHSWRLEGSENVESADEARALLELQLRQRKEVVQAS